MNSKNIPNFERLTELLEEWDKNPDDSTIIIEMLNTEGYEEWLRWMEENNPSKLP